MIRPPLSPVLAPILGSSAYVLEIALFPLVLPELARQFDLGRGDLALIANVYGLAVAAAVLLGGWLGDRLGPLRVFVAGVFLFVLGGLATTLAENLAQLVLARLAQGAGGGLMSPSIPVLLARAGAGRPGRVLALWNALSGFLVAAAPLAALPLTALFGWQAVVVIMAVVGGAAILLTGLTGPIPAAAGPALRLAEGAARRWRLPGSPLVFVFVALNYGTILLFLFVTPLHLSDRPALSASVLGVFWAAFTLAGLALRNRIDGAHVARFLMVSPLFLLAGFALLLGPALPVAGHAAAFLLGVGFALGNAPSTVLILRHAPRGTETLAASLDITCARLGSVLAVAVIGPLAPGPMLAGVLALSVVSLLLIAAQVALRPAA